MKKYKYNINNLDCANCAREIEEALSKDKRFNNVVVNFNTSKLSYESLKDFSLEEVNNLVKKIDDLFPTINSYLSDNYINIRNKKVSKYEGIKFLITNYNLNSKEIYTIGDSINDKEMCENFKSFSFYDADESVKNVSNTILKNFEEAINLLMKKNKKAEKALDKWPWRWYHIPGCAGKLRTTMR